MGFCGTTRLIVLWIPTEINDAQITTFEFIWSFISIWIWYFLINKVKIIHVTNGRDKPIWMRSHQNDTSDWEINRWPIHLDFYQIASELFCICWIGEQRLFRHTISEWTYVSFSHQFLWRNRNWVDSNGKQEIEFYLNYICIDRYDTTFSTMISIVGRKKTLQWQTKLDGFSM